MLVTPEVVSKVRRQAQQARSQATESALLDAGLAHFEEHGFEGLSMQAVAERAGTSIGALYFRFGDRESFVQAVLARGFDRIREDTDRLLAKATAEHASPHAVIRAFVDLAVRVQQNGHGVFRAVLRRALVDPSAWEPVGRLGNDATRRLVAALARHPEVTAIPDWEQRVMFGIYAARGAHFNGMYNAQAPMPREHEALVDMLYGLVTRYLGLPEPTPAAEAAQSATPSTGAAAPASPHSPAATSPAAPPARRRAAPRASSG
ncbi:TetR family transcriptional regulator [Comamonas serinivorans]|uniref:TetR family transcriptional regulator n=1 Tax=Comamonas serinivorans TaxID=1082851 RepID=A0A1Y0EL08_9BURK|nr:TetR/AcrR family transcriptional regulator [Comamonas serinivorans]ARU04267.1 TetR family transcriptional regulator [Comamonas serinivorans]